MKTTILVSAVLALYCSNAFAQDDLQWLIHGGKVKQPTSTSFSMYAGYSTPIPAQFTLYGIRHPDTSSYAFKKNDIFVIYEDGDHYNSRVKNPVIADPGFFYPADGGSLLQDSHNMLSVHASTPLYLYLTNIYEEEDLPTGTGAARGHEGQNQVPYKFDFTSNTTKFFANHDVVYNKDITLIVNLDSLRSSSSNIPDGNFIQFEHVSPVGSPQTLIHNLDFFDAIPVFVHQSGGGTYYYNAYPLGQAFYESNPHRVEIKGGDPDNQYLYVNLRPTSALQPYFQQDPAGNPTHNAVFRIFDRNYNVLETLYEPLRYSHDPNFIRVDSICSNEDGEHIIYYHLQFENTSPTPPDDIQVRFELPFGFLPNCLEVLEWNLKGTSVSGSYVQLGTGSIFTFNIPENGSISRCMHFPDQKDCTGFLRFRVKTADDFRIQDLTNSINMINPYVHFGIISYPIKDFEDLIEFNQKESENSNALIFFRPVKENLCSITCSEPLSWRDMVRDMEEIMESLSEITTPEFDPRRLRVNYRSMKAEMKR